MKRTILRVAVFAIVTLSLQIVSAQVTQAATSTPVPTSSATPEASPTVTSSATPEATEAANVRVSISDTVISSYVISYTVITDTVPMVAPWKLAGESDVIDTYAAGDIIKSATTYGGYVAVKVEDADEGGQARYVWLPEESLEAAERTVMTETVVLAKILVNSLNVRSGPGTGYDVVDSMSQNSTIRILGEEDGWYRIPGNPTDFYISGAPQFVEVIEQEQETGPTPNPVLVKYAEGGAGSIVEIYEQANERFPAANNIVVDPVVGPEAIDAEGNIVAQLFGSGWKTMEEVSVRRYRADELLAEFHNNSEIILAVRRLPTELYVPDYINNEAKPVSLEKDDYTLWFEDDVLWFKVQTDELEKTMFWLEFEETSNWVEHKLGGVNFDIYLDGSFNSPNEYYKNLIADDERILFDIVPATLENLRESPSKKDWAVGVTKETIRSFKETHYFEENIEISHDPTLTGDKLIDDMVSKFSEFLKLGCPSVDGDMCYLESGEGIDLSKKIQFRLMRFPGIDGKGSYAIDGVVCNTPSDPYQIVDGQLFVNFLDHKPSGTGIGLYLSAPLEVLLNTETDLEPDELNEMFFDWPTYYLFRKSAYRLVEVDGELYMLNSLATISYHKDKNTGDWTVGHY